MFVGGDRREGTDMSDSQVPADANASILLITNLVAIVLAAARPSVS